MKQNKTKAQSIKEQWEALPFLDRKHQLMIRKEGTITGSQMFECAEEDADFDIIIPGYKYKDLFNDIIAANAGFYVDNYNDGETQSIYVKTRQYPGPVNLIITKTQENHKAWVRTSYIFKNMCKNSKPFAAAIMNRENRVAVFSAIRNALLNG